jgi:uncharacterized protein YqhQ
MEGVMMRGSKAMAVAVRHPAGHILVHREPLGRFMYDGWISRTPFLRGLVLLWDSLGLGMRSLLFSSNVALESEPSPGSAPAPFQEQPVEVDGPFKGPLAWGTLAISLGLSLGLFFLLPAAAANLIERLLRIESAVASNLLEGLIRLLLLIGYIAAVGLIPEIARVFAHHGAEHKTIMAYEAGAELVPQEVDRFPMYHPRCGTGFLLTVVVISVLLFSLFGRPPLPVRLASRLLLLPMVAGIAYEFIRFTARHQRWRLVRLMTLPNLWLQRLTTRQPDQSMLELAITALRHVLDAEDGREIRSSTWAVTWSSEPSAAPNAAANSMSLDGSAAG